MALVPESPSQEVSSGSAAGSSGDAGPLLGGYTLAVQAPHLAALAARPLLKLVQGLRKLLTLLNARPGALGPSSAAAGEFEGAGC